MPLAACNCLLIEEGEGEVADLDQAQDAPYPEHPDHSEQGRRHGEVNHDVFHQDAENGSQH